MNYQFYVKMDEQEFGPYSLDEIKDLPLLDDTLVTESRLNGEWRPACEFDFQALTEALNGRETTAARQKSEQKPQNMRATSTNSQNSEGDQTPPILNLWNWGAFSLPWIWGICNGIYWPLVIIAFNFIPYAGPFLGLAVSIYLGICGNKLAWDKTKTSNMCARTFTRKQASWNRAGIVIFILVVVIILFYLFVHFNIK